MNADFMRRVAETQMSETVTKVAMFAQNGPFETVEDRNAAFSTAFHQLCLAMDDGKVHFDDDEDRAMFYGLLTVTLVQILGERPVLEKAVKQ